MVSQPVKQEIVQSDPMEHRPSTAHDDLRSTLATLQEVDPGLSGGSSDDHGNLGSSLAKPQQLDSGLSGGSSAVGGNSGSSLSKPHELDSELSGGNSTISNRASRTRDTNRVLAYFWRSRDADGLSTISEAGSNESTVGSNAKSTHDHPKFFPSQQSLVHPAFFGSQQQVPVHHQDTSPAGPPAQVTTEAKPGSQGSERTAVSSLVRQLSDKSVDSIKAIGTHAFGTLRLTEKIPKDEAAKTLAHELHKSGDILIPIDFPADYFLALDAAIFSTKDKSQIVGVKGIPAGAHFLYGGSDDFESLRSGIWIIAGAKRGGEVHVRKYSTLDCSIVEAPSNAEAMFTREDLLNDNRHGGLLNYVTELQESAIGFGGSAPGTELEGIWHGMTWAIHARVLTKITGHDYNTWKIDGADGITLHLDRPTHTFKNQVPGRQNGMGDGRVHQGLTFLFHPNDRTFALYVAGRTRKDQIIDSSVYIKDMIKKHPITQVIAELQFAYATGLLLGNIRLQEQWALMFKVFFKAFKLAVEEPVFYREIVLTVHHQMKFDAGAMDGSIFLHDDQLIPELIKVLTIFKLRLKAKIRRRDSKGRLLNSHVRKLGEAFEEFEKYLVSDWGWDLGQPIGASEIGSDESVTTVDSEDVEAGPNSLLGRIKAKGKDLKAKCKKKFGFR